MPENKDIIIEDNDYLLRRITPHNQQGGVINSPAFMPREDENLSVDIAKLTTPEECLSRSTVEGCWVVKIKAGSVRELGLEVRHNHRGDNPAHGEIEGNLKPHTIRKKLIGKAERIL